MDGMGARRRDGRGHNRSGLIAGRFRLQDVVASGGMGEVYRARDVVSHLQVCVKLVRTDEDREANASRRKRRSCLHSSIRPSCATWPTAWSAGIATL
jgi:serine/threonine protein kinase